MRARVGLRELINDDRIVAAALFHLGNDACALGRKLALAERSELFQRAIDGVLRAHDAGEEVRERKVELLLLDDFLTGLGVLPCHPAAKHGGFYVACGLAVEQGEATLDFAIVKVAIFLHDTGDLFLKVGLCRGIGFCDDRTFLLHGLLAAREDAVDGVVVCLRDGVEHVVVAAGARDGDAEECLREHVDLVVNVVVRVVEAHTDREEA